MHNLLAVLLLATAAQPRVSVAMSAPISPAAVQRRDAIAAQLSPSARLKLHHIATTMVSSPAAITDGTSHAAIQSAFQGVTMSDTDISALTFLVMMEVAEAADHDLQAIMHDVSVINQQKAALRQLLGNTNQAKKPRVQKVYAVASANTVLVVPPPLARNASAEEMQKRLDDLDSLGDEEQVKIQMLTSTRQQAVSMISNILQMLHDTRKGIINNLR